MVSERERVSRRYMAEGQGQEVTEVGQKNGGRAACLLWVGVRSL